MTPQERELLPCPFCSERVAIVLPDGEAYRTVCFSGNPDGIGCGAEGAWRLSKEEAIEAWNRRAALAPPAGE